MVSGRDRDPGYNKKKITKPAAKKPIAAKPAPTKKVEPESKPAAAPAPANAETPKVVTPVTSEKNIPNSAPESTSKPLEKETEIKEEKTERKPVSPPVTPKTKKHNPHKTSKKSKLIGILIAIFFLIGIIAIGYTVVTSIMEKESIEKLDDSFTDDGPKSTGPKTTNAISGDETSDEESESTAEAPQEGAIGQELESEGNNKTESSKETELSKDNNMESEMEEAKEEYSGKSSTDQEKEAIKTKIIRKKGEFELPSWIIAFSANSKKPLANTNYSTLEALGYDAGIYWIPKYFPGGSEMYKVYVGPYKSAQEAESMLPAIKNLQPDAYVMKIEE
mgnify:FL=1